MEKTILITGAAGKTGRALIHALQMMQPASYPGIRVPSESSGRACQRGHGRSGDR